jgi:hypothetical protein
MHKRASQLLRCGILVFVGAILSAGIVSAVEEELPLLNVGDEVYTNVTVTSATATDIYFNHSRGVGNAKLKQLSPELQERFHYDPAKAARKESQQSLENALYNQAARETKPSPKPQRTPNPQLPIATRSQTSNAQNNDGSVGGRRGPEIFVEKWITPQPDTNGKFVLLDFWAPWSFPSKKTIPPLNDFQKKFSKLK